MRLFGLHNPLRESPAFLLPLFDNVQQGDNGLYVQELSYSDQITRMVPVYDGYSCSLSFSKIVVQVGAPGIFAFSVANMDDILSGTREELSPMLMERIDEIASEDRYGLRLKILEFSRRWDLVPSAIRDLYSELHTVSPRSAEFWRDNALLTSRARLILGSLEVPEYEATWDQFLSSVSLRIFEEHPILSAPVSIIGQKDFPSTWLSKLQTELAPYLAPFSQKEIVVEAKSILEPSTATAAARPRDDDPGSILSAPLSWIGVALDKAAVRIAASLSPRQLGFATQVLDCSALETSEATAQFRDHIETGGIAVAPDTIVVLFFDATRQGLSDAMAFASAVSSSVRCHGLAVLHRDAGSELSLEDFEQFGSPLDGITLIASSRLPIRGGVSELMPGGVLRELFNQFGGERASKPFYRTPGISLYATGRSKGGQAALLSALENAVSAAANAELPIELAETARIVGSSVGRPTMPASSFTQELARIVRPERERFSSSFDWARKPFLSGAPQPASIGILWSEFGGRGEKLGLLSACTQMLRASGYEILSNEEAIIATHSGVNQFSVTTSPDVIGDNREFGPEILLCGSSKHQSYELERRFGSFFPLILGDIYYISTDLEDLKWSLEYLMYRRARSGQHDKMLAAMISDQIMSLNARSVYRLDHPRKIVAVFTVDDTSLRLRSHSARRMEFRADSIVIVDREDEYWTASISGFVSPEGIDTDSISILLNSRSDLSVP